VSRTPSALSIRGFKQAIVQIIALIDRQLNFEGENPAASFSDGEDLFGPQF
jgi:hypothetical protein